LFDCITTTAAAGGVVGEKERGKGKLVEEEEKHNMIVNSDGLHHLLTWHSHAGTSSSQKKSENTNSAFLEQNLILEQEILTIRSEFLLQTAPKHAACGSPLRFAAS
jgi:hypothetical protein